jgi:ATP-dependent Clp protease ATP-binding subunit ClpA
MSEKDKGGKDNKKLFDLFDSTLSQVVVHAQAASIEAKVDCLYPESMMIGILTIGGNKVSAVLLNNMGVDLEKSLKAIKKELITKKIFNEDKIVNPNYDDLKVSKTIIDISKSANKFRMSTLPSEFIGIDHMFLSLLSFAPFIKELFGREGVTIEKFTKAIRKFNEDHGGIDKNPVSAGSDTSNSLKKSALKAFCIDVTQEARSNKLDPIIAREKEIEAAITILCRRSKNNPIFLGDAGVGKTAIVEGIAQRIVSGTVPKQIIGHKLYSLSLSSLVAGTKYRGEFEERIQSLVKEVQQANDCILFIDEIHTLVGAGAAGGGSLDASNILKPFLARNDLKCIGATTLDEYKKYFSKDKALARRFQQIAVEEPTKEQMKQILFTVKLKLEKHHDCIITSDAIDSAISLADRYLKDRNFPDKGIDCLDMACAKHAWTDKKDGKPTILASHIASVVSEQCGIPLEVILWDDNERIAKIEHILSDRIIGQKHAVDVVCRTLKNAYSGIRNPDRPIGSFVFGGQSGTGKTYAAKELAKAVFGKDSAFIRLDMTEYSESHSVSKLIGSPPGYVGFQDIDVFVDKIKRRPYCLVLLDEVEKAHPDIIKLFLQVMSDGIMTDASGNKADFKNVVLIMTGNFGMDIVDKKVSLGFGESAKKDSFKESQDRLVDYCKDRYGAEFINRVDEFVPFMPFSDEDLKVIIKIKLDEIGARISGRNCKVVFTDEVYGLLIKLVKSEHGKNATALNRLMSKKIEPCMSDALMSMNKGFHTITIDVKDDAFIYEIK